MKWYACQSILTPMEFSGEFDFCFYLVVAFDERLLGQLNAHLVHSCISRLILVLNVGMDVTEEQLFVVLVGQFQTDSLRCGFAFVSESVVDFDDVVEDGGV